MESGLGMAGRHKHNYSAGSDRLCMRMHSYVREVMIARQATDQAEGRETSTRFVSQPSCPIFSFRENDEGISPYEF